MEEVKIPIPTELPPNPDPLNLIRQRVADEIRRASVYQKHVSIVFKQDPLLCIREMKQSRNLVYPVITWNIDMFKKVAAECGMMGYKVDIEKRSKTASCGNYGVNVIDRVIMDIKWDVTVESNFSNNE